MKALLREKLTHTSSGPGVYLMKDEDGRIIYVGKASGLKRRLASYFSRRARGDVKTGVLVDKIADFETIVTGSEKEALILEANLIKRHKPRYNIILKDDKRYPSLRLDIKSDYPHLAIVRQIGKDDALYFGPYASAAAVRQTLRQIHKTFKLRKCKTGDFSRRTRPCLNFQMDRCLAPCCRPVDPAVYAEIVKEVVLFLKGRTPDLIRKIETQMNQAAQNQDFETAALLRDKMFALTKTLEKQVAVTTDFTDRDVLGIARSPEASIIALLRVRGGFLMGSRLFEFAQTLSTDREMIGEFIRQYYQHREMIPLEILAPLDAADICLLTDWLGAVKGRNVKILHPRRGEKVRLLTLARENAQNGLVNLAEARDASEHLLERLKARLGLMHLPRRIECFDNSNLAGREPVAAMVVFVDGRPEKSAYRHYKLRKAAGRDDYGAMAEILGRRFAKNGASANRPDLVILDGGKGQLNIGLAVLAENGLRDAFDLAGLAKKDEKKGETEDKVYRPGRSNPVNFGRDGGALLLLQQIRDEAHRFAISFNRRRRGRAALHSILDDVSGIGPKRKKALLRHFGSMKKIRQADVDQLAAAPGMTRQAAIALKETLADPSDEKGLQDGSTQSI